MDSTSVLDAINFEAGVTRMAMAESIGWTRQRLSKAEKERHSLRLASVEKLMEIYHLRLVVTDSHGDNVDYPILPNVPFDTFCEILEGCGMTIRVVREDGGSVEIERPEADVSGYKSGSWVNTKRAVVVRELEEGKTLYKMWNGKYFIIAENPDGEPIITKVLDEEQAKEFI